MAPPMIIPPPHTSGSSHGFARKCIVVDGQRYCEEFGVPFNQQVGWFCGGMLAWVALVAVAHQYEKRRGMFMQWPSISAMLAPLFVGLVLAFF